MRVLDKQDMHALDEPSLLTTYYYQPSQSKRNSLIWTKLFVLELLASGASDHTRHSAAFLLPLVEQPQRFVIMELHYT